MKWRTRARRRPGCKYLYLLDSKVAIAVATKRRSSSRKLLRTLRKMDALELAAHFAPIYGYVRSQANPADGPSRRRYWRPGNAPPKRQRGSWSWLSRPTRSARKL